MAVADAKRDPSKPYPLSRRWNASISLGIGGYDDYVKAVKQPGEAEEDARMPHEMTDGSVSIKQLKNVSLNIHI